MKTLSLGFFTMSTILWAVFSKPVRATESRDGFDRLYGKRIELFTKQLDIYKSVANLTSAVKAAKKWSALLPPEKEIKLLEDKLGQPDKERLTELNDKYGKRLNEVSTAMLTAGYGLAEKPYIKLLNIAQLENLAELKGSKKVNQELAVLRRNPKAVAALQAARVAAAQKRAAIKTDPTVDEAFKDYLAATKRLTALLDGIKDEASAKKAAPEAQEQLKKWEAKGKAFEDLATADNTVQKFDTKLKTDMGKLVMTVIKLNGNKTLSEPLKEVIKTIMRFFAGV